MSNDDVGRVVYRLVNGEDINREHPDTFFIPSRYERETVEPGQLVKLIFELVDSDDEDPSAERMWVMVKSRDELVYLGALDNEPYSIPNLHAEDPVMFGPENIIDIYDAD